MRLRVLLILSIARSLVLRKLFNISMPPNLYLHDRKDRQYLSIFQSHTMSSEGQCQTLLIDALNLHKVPLMTGVSNYRHQAVLRGFMILSRTILVYQNKCWIPLEKSLFPLPPLAVKIPCTSYVCPKKSDTQQVIGRKDWTGCLSCQQFRWSLLSSHAWLLK